MRLCSSDNNENKFWNRSRIYESKTMDTEEVYVA